jgi:beta-galactosidase/beta-glucuronidase
VNNGIITADRQPTGKLAEVKRIYQYIKFGTLDKQNQSISVTNAYESLNLQGMTLGWELLLNGKVVQDGSMVLASFASGTTQQVDIPYGTTAEEGEYLLNVYVALSQETPWAQAGHRIAMLLIGKARALMRRIARRQEDHFIRPAARKRLTRQMHVRQMNGIKATAHQTDSPHVHRSCFLFIWTTTDYIKFSPVMKEEKVYIFEKMPTIPAKYRKRRPGI